MEQTLVSIYESVINGQREEVEEGVKKAMAESIPPQRILKEALIAAMGEVGNKFECGDFFVPEMLIAARAMQSGLALLKPYLVQEGIQAVGKVVIGTVKGDLHDIGKNLVAMMLEGAGFEIVDLGTDVTPAKFVDAVKQHNPNLVGMSALLTTTMVNMKATVEALTEAGVRDKVKVMIGGAPVTDAYAQQIGADGFGADASRAVALAKSLVGA
jgi:5-methyltetrahydrofolate--homocysteine methyltransferase